MQTYWLSNNTRSGSYILCGVRTNDVMHSKSALHEFFVFSLGTAWIHFSMKFVPSHDILKSLAIITLRWLIEKKVYEWANHSRITILLSLAMKRCYPFPLKVFTEKYKRERKGWLRSHQSTLLSLLCIKLSIRALSKD